MTWLEFKAAVDTLLVVNADREGTNTVKPLWVRKAALDLQRKIAAYRVGHQNNYEAEDLLPAGLAQQGTLPEGCEPRDCFILREFRVAASNTVDTADDEITATAHGITAATGECDVQRGYFLNEGGALPAGMLENQTYFLRVVDADTITLHTSVRGVLDNTERVDLTADGTGVSLLVWGQQRFPCDAFLWKDRHQMIYGQACVNSGHGLVSFNPNGVTFLVYPRLQSEDALGLAHSFELNWDGVKVEWEDEDDTPFDEQATHAVAEAVEAQFCRHVDRDLPAAAAAEKMSRMAAADCYLDAKRRADLRH